jgi:ABC-2 type transport system permease protein
MTGRLVRSELLKLVSVRTTWALLGTMLFVEGAYAMIFAAVPAKDKLDNPTDLFVGTGIQTVIVFCLGALLSTNEFRHGTANSTFLVTPQRERVLGAKLIVGLGAGIVCALLFIAVNAGLGFSIVSNRGVEVDGTEAVNIYTGVGIGMVLTCLFGVGMGALLRNQVVAVVAGLVIFFVLRGVATLLGAAGGFFPSEALIGLQGALAGDDTLDQVPGGLVFAGYCLVFAVAGAIGLREREIT